MARKPAHLREGNHIDARHAAWAQMRKRDQFSLDDLEIATGDNRGTIATYVQSLEKGGYIEQVGHEAPRRRGQRRTNTLNHKKLYRLVRDVGYHAPRLKRDGSPVTQGKGTENMWRVIKVLSTFDWRELAEAASGSDHTVSPYTAREYIRFLSKAGYLRLVRKGKPGVTDRYTLIESRWSGPYAPQIQNTKHVYDPNLGQVVWPGEAES